MNADKGTIADVLMGVISAVESWAFLLVVTCGLVGMALAISGGKRLYDVAQGPQYRQEAGGYSNGIIMFVSGSMMTIVAFWAAFFSRLFTL